MHPAASALSTGRTAAIEQAESGHQAQYTEMEILSKGTGPDTVSRDQQWPALDTLTTFQMPKNTQRLIVKSTKAIIPI